MPTADIQKSAPVVRQAHTRRWWVITCNMFDGIQGTATLQLPDSQPREVDMAELDTKETNRPDSEKDHIYTERPLGKAGRIFDGLVDLAGTPAVMVLTVAGLIVWAVVGGVLGATQTWQIVIQNVSSIQCYLSDTLLMRQQHNHFRHLVGLLCEMRSRGNSCQRMLDEYREKNPDLVREGPLSTHPTQPAKLSSECIATDINILMDAERLPPHTFYDRLCDPVVSALSSLYAWAIFWAGIIVWLGFGSKLAWGNNWQLYINSATAVELTFATIFLQNTRQRHMRYLQECIKSITLEDALLERRLREITGDIQPNATVSFERDYAKETTRGLKMIDFYSVIVGTLVGVAVSTVVFVVWLGIGKTMSWNSNWWLIIGTYTGLVGFVDGFTLRNVYSRGSNVVEAEFHRLEEDDSKLSYLLGAPYLFDGSEQPSSLQKRISSRFGLWCASSYAVLASLIAVVAVLVIATAMHWSETGQLICNTPTMILEGFLLLILIDSHNQTNTRRRFQCRDALGRRIAMNSYVERHLLKQKGEKHGITAGFGPGYA